MLFKCGVLNVKIANSSGVIFGIINMTYDFICVMSYMIMIINKFNWRASEVSETLSGVYKFELVWYIHVWRYVCHNNLARKVRDKEVLL